MNGRVVTQVIEEGRVFDLLVRMEEENSQRHRTTPSPADRIAGWKTRALGGRCPGLRRGWPEHPSPGKMPDDASSCGSTREAAIWRVSFSRSIRRSRRDVELPEGYFVALGGQFEAQQEATRRIVGLSIAAIVIVFAVLFATFPSTSLVFQILVALPVAFVGGVFALVITGQDLSVAAMVGFISLGGIAVRNGLLLVSTYLDLCKAKRFERSDGGARQSGTDWHRS